MDAHICMCPASGLCNCFKNISYVILWRVSETMKMFVFMKNCSKAARNIIISPNFILHAHYHLKYIYSLSFHKFHLLLVVFLILAFFIPSALKAVFDFFFRRWRFFKHFHSVFPDQRLAPAEMYGFIYPIRFLLYLPEKLTEPLNSDCSCLNIKREEWTKDASLDLFANEQKYRGDPR